MTFALYFFAFSRAKEMQIGETIGIKWVILGFLVSVVSPPIPPCT